MTYQGHHASLVGMKSQQFLSAVACILSVCGSPCCKHIISPPDRYYFILIWGSLFFQCRKSNDQVTSSSNKHPLTFQVSVKVSIIALTVVGLARLNCSMYNIVPHATE